ncbi:MAG: hypothetical protein HY912_09490 [Desulfomonile tiedjei]|uniref:Uncharacterized protein n=1 Tax=Desulfomonile tiedjei TaxID=2358 RepID=A0A9D6V484_9BACT|nr:hypothetical protein [Desulfomonile tiedjei]
MVQEWPYWAATGLVAMIVIALLVFEPIIEAYHRRKMGRDSAGWNQRGRF